LKFRQNTTKVFAQLFSFRIKYNVTI